MHRLGSATFASEPLGRTTSFFRDSLGRLELLTKPSGGQASYAWDGGSTRVEQVANDDVFPTQSVHYVYTDTTYSLPDSIHGDVTTQKLDWDASGRLTSSWIGTPGTVTNYRYVGSADLLDRVVDPTGHVTEYFYATSGFRNLDSVRVKSDSLASTGRTTKFAYDTLGRRVGVTTPENQTTTTIYDELNRVAMTVGPLADTTRYTYDSLYLVEVEDAIGQTYEFTPNALGWVTQRTDPRAETDTYAYDKNGNVTSWTDRRGEVRIAVGHGY